MRVMVIFLGLGNSPSYFPCTLLRLSFLKTVELTLIAVLPRVGDEDWLALSVL